ncbi:hypothetical protein J6590_029794 [Homalodisca vitripennis]|nr:hypothetical protein J6590_029794 [Homalodisca vitripennis]
MLCTGVYVDSPTDFVVDSRAISKADDGKVTCTITNPSGNCTENLITPLADGTYRISYTPFEEGQHTIDILYDGLPIPGSPFVVNVRRGCDPSKCRAYGPGLEHGLVDKSNAFTVETKGAGTGGLGLAIEGPSEAKMTCQDNRDGSCSVEYLPTEPGEYDVSIKFSDQHIPGSPFKVNVDAPLDPTKVQVYGPGVDPENVRERVPTTFKVDTTKAGKGPVQVLLRSDRGPLPQPEVVDNGDGTYNVSYTPPAEGSVVKAYVKHNDKEIPQSPFQMKVKPRCEPKKVKVSGPALSDKGVPASIPTDIIIDPTQAGFGDLEVRVVGPDNYPRKVKVVENADGTYKASFVPDDCGRYKVTVKYGGKEIPTSPIPIQAYATGSADECKITEGIQKTLLSGEEYCITVNAKNAGRGAVTCRIRSTSGSFFIIDFLWISSDEHDSRFQESSLRQHQIPDAVINGK